MSARYEPSADGKVQLLDQAFVDDCFVYHGSWQLDNCIIYGLGSSAPLLDGHRAEGPGNLLVFKVHASTANEAYKHLVKHAPEEMIPPKMLKNDVVDDLDEKLLKPSDLTKLKGSVIKNFVLSQKDKMLVKVTKWAPYTVHTIVWGPEDGLCRLQGTEEAMRNSFRNKITNVTWDRSLGFASHFLGASGKEVLTGSPWPHM